MPENWHKGMTSEPPYIAELEGESPRPPDPLTKDGFKVAFLAHLLQEKVIKTNSKIKKSAPVITLGRAKDLIFAQLSEKRKKPAKFIRQRKSSIPLSSRQSLRPLDMDSWTSKRLCGPACRSKRSTTIRNQQTTTC